MPEIKDPVFLLSKEVEQLKVKIRECEEENRNLTFHIGSIYHHIGNRIKSDDIKLLNSDVTVGYLLSTLGSFIKYPENSHLEKTNILNNLSNLLGTTVSCELDRILAIKIAMNLLCDDSKTRNQDLLNLK